MRHPLHDYASAAGYFVTFVTYHRERFLGQVVEGIFKPSECGKLFAEVWNELPKKFNCVMLDAIQTMPDHVHCILLLVEPRLLGNEGTIADLAKILQSLKGVSARRINRLRESIGQSVWQEGYEDRVIRDDQELEKFRYYILTNPRRWQMDGKG